jgi:hypothetical protein
MQAQKTDHRAAVVHREIEDKGFLSAEGRVFLKRARPDSQGGVRAAQHQDERLIRASFRQARSKASKSAAILRIVQLRPPIGQRKKEHNLSANQQPERPQNRSPRAPGQITP